MLLARPPPRMPPLIALRAFEVVGRTGSIRAAGDELGVSHTVVSRHVRNLEEHIGFDLVRPQGRGIILTARGRRFHRQISSAFAEILRATAELSPAYRQSLQVWCMPGVAYRLLIPLLEELQASLVNVDLSFRPTLERPNLLNGDADAEIYYLDRLELDEGIHFEELARPRVFPVASPSFIDSHPELRTVRDIVTAPLLHEQSTRYWASWLTAAGLSDLPPLHGPKLWHANFTLDAAARGYGVALTNSFLFQSFEGDLTELFATDLSIGAYYLLAPTVRWNTPEIRSLFAWAGRVFASAGSGV